MPELHRPSSQPRAKHHLWILGKALKASMFWLPPPASAPSGRQGWSTSQEEGGFCSWCLAGPYQFISIRLRCWHSSQFQVRSTQSLFQKLGWRHIVKKILYYKISLQCYTERQKLIFWQRWGIKMHSIAIFTFFSDRNWKGSHTCTFKISTLLKKEMCIKKRLSC